MLIFLTIKSENIMANCIASEIGDVRVFFKVVEKAAVTNGRFAKQAV